MPQGLKASDFLNLYQSAQNPKAKGLMSTISTIPTTPAAPAGPTAPPSLTPNAPLLSRLYRLTVRQYHQMIQDGVLGKRDRVELIEGLLVVKMSKNSPHIVAGNLGREA